MTDLMPYGDRRPAVRVVRNLPVPFPIDPERTRSTRGRADHAVADEALPVDQPQDVDESSGDNAPAVGCDDPWRIRQVTDWRRIGRATGFTGCVAAGAGITYTATHLTTSVSGPVGLLAAAITGTLAVLVANARRRVQDPTRQPIEPHAPVGPTTASSSELGVEVAGWVWRCRPCATVSVEVVTDAVAAHLADVYDQLHHGRTRTAAVTTGPHGRRDVRALDELDRSARIHAVHLTVRPAQPSRTAATGRWSR